jgi:predicted RNase H-like HicB family nuclease
MIFKVRVMVEKDEGSYHAFCPDLKGLHVDGDTPEEAFAVAKDAVAAYIESLIRHGDPIPVGCIGNHRESVGKAFCSTFINSNKFQEEYVLATI